MKRDGNLKSDRLDQSSGSKIWFGIFITLFLFSISNTYAQSSTGTISGTVIDAETELPLISATIFLSGTTIGVASDTDGNFILNNVPAGIYELVVRYIGYEQMVIPFEIKAGDSQNFGDLHLHAESFVLDDIVVEAGRDQVWLDNLSFFKRSFLGQSSNADLTEIINGEVLEFSIDRSTGELLATAESELHIINKALGYELFTELVSFRFDIRNDTGFYFHRTRFKELETDDQKQNEIWRNNRYKTYYGSFNHFLTTLTDSTANQVFNIVNGDVTHVNTRRATVHGGTLRTEQLVFLVETRRNIPLAVRYQNSVRSELEFSSLSVLLVDTYGTLMNPHEVTIYGDWAKERMADLLPSDIYLQNGK